MNSILIYFGWLSKNWKVPALGNIQQTLNVRALRSLKSSPSGIVNTFAGTHEKLTAGGQLRGSLWHLGEHPCSVRALVSSVFGLPCGRGIASQGHGSCGVERGNPVKETVGAPNTQGAETGTLTWWRPLGGSLARSAAWSSDSLIEVPTLGGWNEA